MSAPNPLLERDDEVAAIARSLDGALAGNGGVLTIEGEAGAGKTSLLNAAARTAADQGMAVLRARGGEYERDFPYGVVRQLFEPLLVDLDRRAELLRGTAAMATAIFEPGSAQGRGDPLGAQHGLFWLLANLAETGPLGIVVDDAQWSDLASLHALVYCARRLEGLPIALMLTIRTGEAGTPAGLLGELRQAASARRIVPAPLSAAAARDLIVAAGRDAPSRRFVEACCSATAGNPLLLVELLRGLDSDGSRATEESAERLAELAAAGVSGSILARLGRLGEDAAALAEAVAVLEPDAAIRDVAALVELPSGRVAEVAEGLIAANLLFDARPLGFVHPLVRAAVLSGMPEPRRALAHARAARLLADGGAADDTVAAHLLLAEPDGDAWVVERLCAAADVACARGTPAVAVSYLRRALREPPDDRTAVMSALGHALLTDFDPEGLDVLRALRAASDDPAERAALAATLANSLSLRTGGAEATALLEESMSELGDPASRLGLQLRARILQLLGLGLERVPAGALPGPGEEVSVKTIEGRAFYQYVAVLWALGLGSTEQAGELIARVTADPETLEGDAMAGFPGQAASVALVLCDRGERAVELCTFGIEAARRRGALLGIPGNRSLRAMCRYVDGALREAQEDAELASSLWARDGFGAAGLLLAATTIHIATARGDLASAAALAQKGSEEGDVAGIPGGVLCCARGELHLATRQPAAAREDFLTAARCLAWLPAANPELLGWRVGLAQAHAALGDGKEARAEAARAVALARQDGGRRVLGVALRVQGLVAGDGTEAVAILGEAVTALEGTRARFQHAQALVDLGAALRRANRRRDAREPLRAGLELAYQCGAVPLEERARAELAATGARPRKALRSGVDALTPSELRVAQMAAEGMANREIAQSLFITAKTVETHLHHAYQKLDVAKRVELASVLGRA